MSWLACRDDPNRKGKNLNGVEILGTLDSIPALVRDKQIDVIVIARRPAFQRTDVAAYFHLSGNPGPSQSLA